MSLTSFLKLADVKTKVALLRPKGQRRIPVPVKASPRTKRPPLVGTAFDYLLRFELQRRAPHAVAYPWIAEQVPDLIHRRTGTTSSFQELPMNPNSDLLPEEVAE